MTLLHTLHAPAKLNFTLEVLEGTSGGLHTLRSVMVPIALYDEIRILLGTSSPGFTSSHAGLEKDNLIMRALESLRVDLNAVGVHLLKHIPVGAGLGGGSSDAASILIAASSGAFGNGGNNDFLSLAQTLGSDVPFFLTQTGALVEGSGERVTAIGALPPWWSVVVHPPVHVSTAAAYAALDVARAGRRQRRARRDSASLNAVSALQRADFPAVQQLLTNDFQSIMSVRHAPVREALDALRVAGAQNPSLTGSGSCVFALAQTQDEAQGLLSRLRLAATFRTYVAALHHSPAWLSARAAT